MGRSIKKGPYVEHHLQKKIDAANINNDKKAIKTWSRRSLITPEFIGLTFRVHNGNKFIPVYVIGEMVGHRLGEFSATRTYRGHEKKSKK